MSSTNLERALPAPSRACDAPPTRAAAATAGVFAALGDRRVLDLTTGITCVLILLTGPEEWYVAVFASALAAGALLFRELRRSAAVWMFLFASVGASALLNWETTDNHKYLLSYWCMAIALSFHSAEPRVYLAKSGRLLIGGCFALAVYWKLRTPDFATGDFFRLELLTDRRFASVTSWIGGMPVEDLRAFQGRWRALDGVSALGALEPWSIPISPRVDTLAVAMTWWTLFIEGWIALAFLMPDTSRIGRLRDVPLIAFVVTTYAVATVLGFGYVLLAMGLCQTRTAKARLGYIVAFFVLFVFQIPVFALSRG